MPQANNPDTEFYLIIGIVIAAILILTIYGLCLFFNEFSRDLKYINYEISRTEGDERRYWLCQRRRLWLSLIPFVKY